VYEFLAKAWKLANDKATVGALFFLMLSWRF
jgi:hypothetical protein